MLNKINIGKYTKTDSNLDDMNTLVKIISVLLCIITILISKDLFTHIFMSIVVILLVLSSKIDLKNYYKSIFNLKWFLLFIFLINLLFSLNLLSSILIIIKIILIMLISNVLLFTTTITNMTKGLESLLKPLKIFRVPVTSLALTISLALRFIPIILDKTNNIMLVLKSRGLSYEESNFKTKLKILKLIILPIFITSINSADNVSEALELKHYNTNRITYEKYKYTLYDLVFLLSYVFIFVLMIIKGGTI